jgi:hypothetical protein
VTKFWVVGVGLSLVTAKALAEAKVVVLILLEKMD